MDRSDNSAFDDYIRVERILDTYDREKDIFGILSETAERAIKDVLARAHLEVSTVTSRVKKRSSLARKVHGVPRYESLAHVTDVVGARVVTYFEDDVDDVIRLIDKAFLVDWWHSIDKRRTLVLDQFGYQSAHLVAVLLPEQLPASQRMLNGRKFEIQVRSLAQHTWAEINHRLSYKSLSSVPSAVLRRLFRAAALLETADEEFLAAKKIAQEVQSKLERCRAEGITEAVPSFSLDISAAAADAVNVSDTELILFMNTAVTNPPKRDSEVILYPEVGALSCQRALGEPVGSNGIAFRGVFPLATRPKESVRVQIAGVRINASSLGVAPLIPRTVQASVVLRLRGASYPVGDPIDLLQTANSLSARCELPEFPGIARADLSRDRLPTRVSVLCRCTQAFPGAFRPSQGEQTHDSRPTSRSGTRIMILVHGLPQEVRVYASNSDLAEDATFALTTTDANGAGPFARVRGLVEYEFGGRSLEGAELVPQDGVAQAVWECVANTGTHLTFGLVLAFPAETLPCEIRMGVSLAPISTVTTASESAPVPRFCNTFDATTIVRIVELT